MSFWDGFEKKAFGAIDPSTAGAAGGLLSGYQTGRSAAGTTSNMLSAKGSKTKNEELARNIAKLTAPAGAIGGMVLGLKHRQKLLDLFAKKVSREPEMMALATGLVPFLAGTAGGGAAGAGTGALTSLRGRFGGKKKDRGGDGKD